MAGSASPIREMDGRRDAGRHAGSRNERATGTPHQYITLKADVLRGRRGGVKDVHRAGSQSQSRGPD